MKYDEFISQGREIAKTQQRQGIEYFDLHSHRFYKTFSRAKDIIKDTHDSILSLGAGSAYIEIMLRKHLDVNITVIDFPRAINSHQNIYDKYGIDYIGADITEYEFDKKEGWQFAMCNEIIEHIPHPPKLIFKKLRNSLTDGGEILITTPNFARINNVFEIIVGHNPQPDPEELFATVDYENEGIHRREYVKGELYDALECAGFKPVSSSYINLKDWRELYEDHKKSYKIAALPLMYFFPRLRFTIMITAKIH